MTGTINTMFDTFDDPSQRVILRIWSKTGAIFQETFSIDQTTFADVKHLAMRFFVKNLSRSLEERDNYKLLSIETRKTMDEEKTLREDKVKNGDEYLLAEKSSTQLSKLPKTPKFSPIDEKLIERRTRDLPSSPRLRSQADRLLRTTELRTDLGGILLTLIETSQKLLWYHPNAEHIFRQAEEILSRSSVESDDVETYPNEIAKLVDIGFTERQAQIALKRTKYDFHAAMELLLTQPDIDENEKEIKISKKTTPFYSRNGPFIPFRQIRHQYFKPNPTALQSLQEMGFNENEIIDALRICRNNQTLACDYLIGDKQQQQTISDAVNDRSLDSNSRLFQIIMENLTIQQSLNNPKIFFMMLQLYEDPTSIGIYINDPDIGNMLLQISRIYNTERFQMNATQ